jgi:hypothetical protein
MIGSGIVRSEVGATAVLLCRCRFNPVMMAPISSTRSAGVGPGGGAP